jgi:predicted CoA-substrate-specific enzyme activase
MKRVGLDVGSTTVKAVVVDESGHTVWRDYQRHQTRQAEKVLDFLLRMEREAGLAAGQAQLFCTGSGAGLLAPLLGARAVQEVVAVAAAVEKLHPGVRFVSEIGGEDMKTIFLSPTGERVRRVIPIQAAGQPAADTGRADAGLSKQVYMQSACSGGTGTFIEKTAHKLGITAQRLAAMPYEGMNLHRVSSKCGIFAEADANTLVKSGVPAEEVIASLFEAVVYQNLATLTKGNTPLPEVLLLGGPNLFFHGLQQAWRRHLRRLWDERGVELPAGRDPDSLILVPDDALYYAALGCIEVGRVAAGDDALYRGVHALRHWIDVGQQQRKAEEGRQGLAGNEAELRDFLRRYAPAAQAPAPARRGAGAGRVFLGCDLGSTTAKAVVLDEHRNIAFDCYTLSQGNPIEDCQVILRQVREAGFERIDGLALTGYGKDLMKDIVGADVAVVETVAHATAALHFFPDADVICDVGGVDVKIMLLRQGTVSDFRLNSQCSSGNGAFLQGVAECYGTPLSEYADRAFAAGAVPELAMGCGVFLQSDIVNQQRKGWAAEEIMAALVAVLPLNVWVYAGQMQNLAAAGRRFVLQGGTHRNLAVVKAQVDFIRSKVRDAEVLLHPHPGEAGAIGAALCAADQWHGKQPSRFRGFDFIEGLSWRSTTSEDTVCHWCAVNCRRTFIDVAVEGAAGREWSKVPLSPGWERVISGNTCPKGLMEDARQMRVVKDALEAARREHPNLAQLVRDSAFSRPAVTIKPSQPKSRPAWLRPLAWLGAK